MEQNKKIKVTIIVLAVLLGISVLALGGTLVYNKLANKTPETVIVPDNLITPEEEDTRAPSGTSDGSGAASAAPSGTTGSSQSPTAQRKAAVIELYNRQPEENTPFKVGNMFPGDRETKYYRVQVSYQDQVTVHYKATVRPGYEKLAEVLRVRVLLLTTGETLYDGLMRDMPASLTHVLSSQSAATGQLYYEITAYLDTSVGNDYQNKDLVADFAWWVEETGNLGPNTGDTSHSLLWAVIAVGSGGAIVVLLVVSKKRKSHKGDEENG